IPDCTWACLLPVIDRMTSSCCGVSAREVYAAAGGIVLAKSSQKAPKFLPRKLPNPGGVMGGGTRPSYEFGPFRLDLSEHQLLRDGWPVPLTPKAFELLRVLVQPAGHLGEKDTLLKEVWPSNFVEEGALNRTISSSASSLAKVPGAS